MALLLDRPMWPAHGTLWAHLVSDVSLSELHAFAAANGLPPRSFDLDHYDVPARDHSRLLAAGAQQVTSRELIVRLRASGLRVTAAHRRDARRIELARQWRDLLPHAPHVGAELLRRWSEPHRRHHGLSHLRAMLYDIAALAGGRPPEAVVLLAAWLHDAVWHGRSPDDEEASAELAGLLLADHLRAAQVAEVQRMVRLTAEHASDAAAQAVRATPAALLLDADLAVLGSHPSRYARYVREIRAEYPHVPDDDFRRGRRRVLEALLARRHLFVTPRGREWWEEQARRNMAAELAALPAITP